MYNHLPEGGVKQIKMKTLRLELGKTYRNREGEEVRIVRKDNTDRYPYQGNDLHSYAESGRFYLDKESEFDLIEEAPSAQPEKRTFKIPENTREISVNETDGRIVIEFVSEAPEFKEGDIVFEDGRVMIVKAYPSYHHANAYPKIEGLNIDGEYGLPFTAPTFRLATPTEAQQLFNALAKVGKRWNPETMQVEDVPESTRILEWAMEHYSNYEGIAEAIEAYLKQKEGEK